MPNNDGQPRAKDGKWTRKIGAPTLVVAAGVAISSTGGTTGGTASIDSGANSAGKSASRDSAKKGQRESAWQRAGLKTIKKVAKRELRCAIPSFGQVREFFVRHPCHELDRTLLVIGDGRGNDIAVSIAWVRMGSADTAAELKTLVDTDGTGNVAPLGGPLLGLADIDFSGRHHDSRQDGTLVVIAETEPAAGSPGADVLDDAAEIADEFPAP